jgi:hypothetical protein
MELAVVSITTVKQFAKIFVQFEINSELIRKIKLNKINSIEDILKPFFKTILWNIPRKGKIIESY